MIACNCWIESVSMRGDIDARRIIDQKHRNKVTDEVKIIENGEIYVIKAIAKVA